MAADRADAADGAGTLDLNRLGHGLAHPVGWDPVLVIAAIAGLYVLFRADGGDAAHRWRGVLVASLIAAPLVATLLAAVAVPVHTGALLLSAPGVALAAGAAVRLLTGARGLVWAGLALLVVASAATLAVRLSTGPTEDWRALATAVRRVRGQHETVVLVPPSSRDVFAYYAPYVPVISYARGDGAWIAVSAATPAEAITAARASSALRGTPCGSSATAMGCGYSTGCGHEPASGALPPGDVPRAREESSRAHALVEVDGVT